MENKSKKGLKILGVGAIATVSLLSLAGCSISDTEKADMMEGLKNANTFMEESIKKLTEQNNLLDEQNEILTEQNLGLQECINTLNSVTKEEAYNKFKLAVAKYRADYNGVRSNLKVTTTMKYDGSTARGEVGFYRSSENGYVTYVNYVGESGKEEGDSDYTLTYMSGDKVYCFTKSNEHAQREELDQSTSEDDTSGLLRYNFLIDFTLTEDDIVSVEILENGNYLITMLDGVDEGTNLEGEGKQTLIYEYEITPDCKFVKTRGVYVSEEYTEDGKFNIEYVRDVECKYQYGVITEEYINSLIAESEASVETPTDDTTE